MCFVFYKIFDIDWLVLVIERCLLWLLYILKLYFDMIVYILGVVLKYSFSVYSDYNEYFLVVKVD